MSGNCNWELKFKIIIEIRVEVGKKLGKELYKNEIWKFRIERKEVDGKKK